MVLFCPEVLDFLVANVTILTEQITWNPDIAD